MMARKRRRSPCLPWFLGVTAIVFFLAFLVLNYFYGVFTKFNSNPFTGISRAGVSVDLSQRTNIFLVGVDAPSLKEPARSDTMIVMSFEPKTEKLYMLSIPRDSRVEIPGSGMDKINAANNSAYAEGFGTQKLIETVERLLDIKINAYIKTNFRGFVKIIDILGGIDLLIEKDMIYYDPVDHYKIDLKKGTTHLNGSMALQYVRFRSDSADYQIRDGLPSGRVGRQSKFIKALFKQVVAPKNWLKLGQVMEAAADAIETDLSPSLILRFAMLVRNIKPENIIVLTFPGKDEYINKISFFIPNLEKIKTLVDENLKDGTPKKQPVP